MLDETATTSVNHQKSMPSDKIYGRTSEGNPYIPRHIVAVFNENTTLSKGDELGVFVKEICIGSTCVTDPSSPVVISLPTDDPTTPSIVGAQPGDTLNFKLLHLGKEYKLQSQNQKDLIFEPCDTKVIKF